MTKKRSVLITGASRGIGAATARLFAEAGDRVFINYCRSDERAAALAAELNAQGGEAIPIRADVSDSAQVNRMFSQIADYCGGADVLVNNAGIAQTRLFTDITDSDWQTMLSINLSSVFYCCRAALPYMIRRHYGRIVNVSSIWGEAGGSCEVHYSAAKAGVIGLTKALAAEEGLSGITVNCVAPGVIHTDMTAHFSEEDMKALQEQTAVNSLGTPEDVARAIFFLASDKSGFITGHTLSVNGGM